MQFKVLYIQNIQWNKNVLVVSPDVPYFIHLSVGSFADNGNEGGSNEVVLPLTKVKNPEIVSKMDVSQKRS